jgi:hypothetical protein
MQDVEGAVSYVKGVISDLLMNRMDLSLLVVTKVRSDHGMTSRSIAWVHSRSDLLGTFTHTCPHSVNTQAVWVDSKCRQRCRA